MRHRRADVVARAVGLLGEVGLPDLTMRRLGAELGVQPSAIYHHFPNKQALLGAVADEIIARGPKTEAANAPWDEQVARRCVDLRTTVLAYQDGADLVASMWAFDLGGQAPYDGLVTVLEGGGIDVKLAKVAARTLLHFVYGHAIDEQVHTQAARLGVIDNQLRDQQDFEDGLAIVVVGISARAGVQLSASVRDR